MNKTQLKKDLKKISLDLITDLSTILDKNDEADDLSKIELYYNMTHEDVIMNDAVKHLLPHKINIKKRNIKFFENNKYLFGDLPEDKVEYYGNIIKSKKRVSADDLTMIWDYIDVMIEYAEAYKKLI